MVENIGLNSFSYNKLLCVMVAGILQSIFNVEAALFAVI